MKRKVAVYSFLIFYFKYKLSHSIGILPICTVMSTKDMEMKMNDSVNTAMYPNSFSWDVNTNRGMPRDLEPSQGYARHETQKEEKADYSSTIWQPLPC